MQSGCKSPLLCRNLLPPYSRYNFDETMAFFFFPKGPSAEAPDALQLEAYCAALHYSLSTDLLTLCLLQSGTGLLNEAMLISLGTVKNFPKKL